VGTTEVVIDTLRRTWIVCYVVGDSMVNIIVLWSP